MTTYGVVMIIIVALCNNGCGAAIHTVRFEDLAHCAAAKEQIMGDYRDWPKPSVQCVDGAVQ